MTSTDREYKQYADHHDSVKLGILQLPTIQSQVASVTNQNLQSMMIFIIHRRLQASWHLCLNHAGVTIPTKVITHGPLDLSSTGLHIVRLMVMHMGERRRHSMDHDPAVVEQIYGGNLHVVDLHRRQRSSATCGGHHQAVPVVHSRQIRLRRQAHELRRGQTLVRHHVIPETRQIGVSCAGEDRGVVERENRHRFQIRELEVLHAQRE